MKEFRCGDVIPGCDATFEYDSYPELVGMVLGHFREQHVNGDSMRRIVEGLQGRWHGRR